MGHNERMQELERSTEALRQVNNRLAARPQPKVLRSSILRGAIVGGVSIELVHLNEAVPGIGVAAYARQERYVVRRDGVEIASARPWCHPVSHQEARAKVELAYGQALAEELKVSAAKVLAEPE